MTSGTVKWFNPDKGFGFITQENGPDVYVGINEVKSAGMTTLEEDQKVEFEISDSPKGPHASMLKTV
ncbi:MAG TPA: cold-shock protein [Actinomycetota bacterium]|jgi:CspA family cold shock protein|nr:cold-shock protein [Actinomycetota bacterium]